MAEGATAMTAAYSDDRSGEATAQPRPRRTLVWLMLLGMAGLAIYLRWHLLWTSGRLSFGSYDDGVYFTAALNLVHGQLPYRDFLLLHPPGITLILAPFAALAQWVGDAHAFILARLAFIVLGGISALLVARILLRWGLAAALTGGLLYAVAFPAIYTEKTTTLEAPATTLILAGILALQHALSVPARRRWFVIAGVLVGLAVTIKIWYIVPLVLVILFARGGRLRTLLGGAAAMVAVLLPFFALAPVKMFQQLVLAQVGRSHGNYELTTRLRTMLGVDGIVDDTRLPGLDARWTLIVMLLVMLVAGITCLVRRDTRFFAVLAFAHAAILLLSGPFFLHYGILTAAPFALLVGAAVGVLASLRLGRPVAFLSVPIVLALALVINLPHDLGTTNRTMPVAKMKAALAQVDGCVRADDPTTLVILNRISKDLANGCHIEADPSGHGYVLGSAADREHGRGNNPAFQTFIKDYLLGGEAFMRTRGGGLGLSDTVREQVDNTPVLFKQGKYVIHLTK